LEIEAKYAIADERTFERLRSLDKIGDYTLTPCGEQDVADVYLDTEGRDLLNAGWGCRVRDGVRPGRSLVTLKSIGRARGSVHRREEHEIEVAAGLGIDAWPPGPVRDTALEVSSGRPLVPLLTLRQQRALHDVRRRERVVAVRFLDRVEIRAGNEQRIDLEMEIELSGDGTLADLQDLEQALRRFRLQPHNRSKLERALAWVGSRPATSAPPSAAPDATVSPPVDTHQEHAPAHHERRAAPAATPKHRTRGRADLPEPPRAKRAAPPDPESAPAHRHGHAGAHTRAVAPASAAAKKKRKGPGVRADEPIAEAGRKILAFHRDRMLAHEDGTRAGVDPEELHDMRVATRRQRAALRIVEPYFKPKALRSTRDGIRGIAAVLGAVRDLDVLLEAARSYRDTLEAEEAVALEPLLDHWTVRRDAARAAMLAHLDSDAWATFKGDYALFLATPGAGVRPAVDGEVPRPQLVAHVLPAEIWQHYGAIRAYEPVLQWAAVETLHALRIECKRLRYVLEFFGDVLEPEVEEPIAALVALQDHLGLLNDSHVTIGLVREFLAGSHAAGQTVGVAAGRYLEFHEERVQALRHGVGAPWRRVASTEFRFGLARAVAVL
jgi:CHAD domain-containing protein